MILWNKNINDLVILHLFIVKKNLKIVYLHNTERGRQFEHNFYILTSKYYLKNKIPWRDSINKI